MRAAFHYGGGHLARRLAARLHGSQWREKLRPNAAEDFAERIFYAVGHTLCTVIGGWVCLRNGWLTGPGELFFTSPFFVAFFVLSSAFGWPVLAALRLNSLEE